MKIKSTINNMNFWNTLQRPLFALAPMADVTDPAFRRIITKYGKPDVFWTEFVSADGLCHKDGREALIKDLAYTEEERPIVAQLFSSKPENMRSASRLCAELGFDGIDINMGCPDRTIEKQGCGSAMIKTPDIAEEIIQSVKDGIKDAGKDIPVSVKTRIGYYKNEIETWIPFLLQQNIAALTVHLRTRKEMSEVSAHWEYMPRIVELRDQNAPQTLIIGNGDVVDMNDAREKAKMTGCDGIMLGRAVFGNPWLFNNKSLNKKNTVFKDNLHKFFLCIGLIKKDRFWLRNKTNVSISEKLNVLVEHAELFEKLLPHKNFSIMKKHFKAYVNGFPGAKELRVKLMETSNTKEIRSTVDNFIVEK